MENQQRSLRLRRREVLATTVAGTAVGLAGCLSDGGGEVDDERAGDTGTAGSDDSETGGPDADGEILSPPVKGDPDAAITVEVYEDFGCPGCQFYHQNVLPAVEADFLDDGRVRYEHRDLPLPASDLSWETANAARAVQDRDGDDAFWEYASAVYENQENLTLDLLGDLGEDIGIDGDEVRTEAAEQAYDQTVSTDRQRAIDEGVESTPTVVVDGELVDWGDGIEYTPVEAAIEAAFD